MRSSSAKRPPFVSGSRAGVLLHASSRASKLLNLYLVRPRTSCSAPSDVLTRYWTFAILQVLERVVFLAADDDWLPLDDAPASRTEQPRQCPVACGALKREDACRHGGVRGRRHRPTRARTVARGFVDRTARLRSGAQTWPSRLGRFDEGAHNREPRAGWTTLGKPSPETTIRSRVPLTCESVGGWAAGAVSADKSPTSELADLQLR